MRKIIAVITLAALGLLVASPAAAFSFNVKNILDDSLAKIKAKRMVKVDMDNDNDMDVLGTSYGGGKTYWWENGGDQNFTQHQINFATAHWVRAVDLDEDSDMDIVGSSCGTYVKWWENDGSQNFTSHTITYSFYCAAQVCVADIDNDGDIDLLASAEQSNQIAWWENDGEQNFTKHPVSEKEQAYQKTIKSSEIAHKENIAKMREGVMHQTSAAIDKLKQSNISLEKINSDNKDALLKLQQSSQQSIQYKNAMNEMTKDVNKMREQFMNNLNQQHEESNLVIKEREELIDQMKISLESLRKEVLSNRVLFYASGNLTDNLRSELAEKNAELVKIKNTHIGFCI